MKSKAEIREKLVHHETSLAQWESGFLAPTEPDDDERRRVMARLAAAIYTLYWVLDLSQDTPNKTGA
jgi:hypothetical protein